MPAPPVLTYLGSAVTVLGKIGDYLAAPIGRQCTYMCFFNSNITELETQLKELETTRQGVQMGVDDTHRKARVVGPTVEAWLTRANEVTRDVKGIIQDKAKVNEGCLKGWCPNLKLRYSLSKKAVKKTKVVVDLQSAGVQYTKSSYSPPPACTETIPNRDFTMFESRRLNMEEIIKALKPNEINLIGICGLPGVGKTKMVQEVRKRGKEEKHFDEVAFSVVGPNPDLTKLQKCIGESLGIASIGRFDDASTRAGLLHERLVQDNKKILLILDDVWEEFDLQDMGIPLGGSNKNFKMLYTSRIQHLWHNLQTKKEISLELLSEHEAWLLFKEKTGNLVDAPNLQPIAKQIVNECGRLPLALVIIGSTLSKKSGGNSTKDIWEEMLDRLTCPSGTPANKRLLVSLETSYNYVEDEEAKHLFLLCCLFEEDKYISIEDLARCGLGLSLFHGIHELRKVRRRVITLVDDLMSRYLLLDSEIDGHVKLHDVVRDMGIYIASRDKVSLVSHGNMSVWPKDDTYEDYTSISVTSQKIIEFLEGFRCPNLQFLLLRCQNLDEMPCNFFEGIKILRVLVLKGYSAAPSGYLRNCFLALQCLRHLRTLRLENLNATMENASAIGDLEDLEILSLVGCSIDELPTQIGKLTKLRLLDLTHCRLRRIPAGVISRLVGLEELYMIGCTFVDWEREGNEKGINASLREFEFLLKLNTLEVRITDAALWQKIPIFSKLTNFLIEIDDPIFGFVDSRFRRPKPNCLSISSWKPILSDYGGLNSLLRRTECLVLEGEGTCDLVRELFVEGPKGLQLLKDLFIGRCATPECLANTMNPPRQVHATAHPVLPVLKTLRLYQLANLRQICHGPVPARSFGELTSLTIEACVAVEEVIRNDREEDAHMPTKTIEFPKLESLMLRGLPSLVGFCTRIDKINFPELKELSIADIDQLKGLFPTKTYLSSDIKENNNVGFLSLFPQEVSLPNLETLKLINLQNLETLGHGPLSFGSLSKLKRIYVRYCGKLHCVFPSKLPPILQDLEKLAVELEGVDASESNADIFSPVKITLGYLPKLKYISKRDPMVFKYIHSLDIFKCDSLRYVFAPTMTKSIPQLRELKIAGCEVLSRIVAEENGLGESSVDEVEFPQLARLELSNLPNLVSFFPKVTTTPQPLFNGKVPFPSLKYLELQRLKNSSDLWFSDLEKLVVELEGVDASEPNTDILSPVKIKLRNLPELNYISKRDPVVFKYIHTLEIFKCDSLRFVFAPTMMKSIPQLCELKISGCEMLSRIVAEENGLGESSVDEVEFPQLARLKLLNLPNLVSFFPKVTTTPQPLFNRNVAIRSLKYLELHRLKNLSDIWFNELPTSSFSELKELEVMDCENLRSTFHPSMVEALVNLERLVIRNCSKMEAIVDLEEKEQGRKIDKAMFPRLRKMELDSLPNLRMFYHFTCPFEFPLLSQMAIQDCPSMDAFSLGHFLSGTSSKDILNHFRRFTESDSTEQD